MAGSANAAAAATPSPTAKALEFSNLRPAGRYCCGLRRRRKAKHRRAGCNRERKIPKQRSPARPAAQLHSRNTASTASAASFEGGQFAENLKTFVALIAGPRLQALRAKTLHGKRSHHSAVKKRPLQHFAIQFFLRRHVAHK